MPSKTLLYSTKTELVTLFLKITNYIQSQPILPHELKMLIHFLELPPEFEHKRFTAVAKKRVMVLTNTSMYNVSTVVQRLIKKGYLRRDTDKVIYPAKFIQQLLKSKNSFEIVFSFVQDTRETSHQDG
jgi:hypothetical protein